MCVCCFMFFRIKYVSEGNIGTFTPVLPDSYNIKKRVGLKISLTRLLYE